MFSSVAKTAGELFPDTTIQMTFRRRTRAGLCSLVDAVRAGTDDLMIETGGPDGGVVESDEDWPRLAEVRFEEYGSTILGPDSLESRSHVVVNAQ